MGWDRMTSILLTSLYHSKDIKPATEMRIADCRTVVLSTIILSDSPFRVHPNEPIQYGTWDLSAPFVLFQYR